MLDATRILSCATGVPPRRFTQDEVFRVLGYTSPRIRRIFLNSDIEYRHFWTDPDTFTPHETPDQLHARYREASMHLACLAASAARVRFCARKPWPPRAGPPWRTQGD